jgi:carbonic anhydrase/acetyltransferase-like protein (isoleucine patch superfamily)
MCRCNKQRTTTIFILIAIFKHVKYAFDVSAFSNDTGQKGVSFEEEINFRLVTMIHGCRIADASVLIADASVLIADASVLIADASVLIADASVLNLLF